MELAANGLPACFKRLAGSAEQPGPSSSSAAQPAAAASDLMSPVASPPVMCWICGGGFTHNGAYLQHCTNAHGGYAEYRKRLLWRAQQDGLKPLSPRVSQHLLRSATSHLTCSEPASFTLHWDHPEAFSAAQRRCEVACAVRARAYWLENRCPENLRQKATAHGPFSQLYHTQCGRSSLLTCGAFCAVATAPWSTKTFRVCATRTDDR